MIYAIIAAAGVAMLGAIIWLARREGRVSAQRDAAATGLDEARKANEIDETIDGLDTAALDSELKDEKRK